MPQPDLLWKISQLLRPPPGPELGVYGNQLRGAIRTRLRVVMAGTWLVAGVGLPVLFALAGVPMWLQSLLAAGVIFVGLAYIERTSDRLTRDHLNRVRQVRARQDRLTRLGRVGPLAAGDCLKCRAVAGTRHQVWCPTVPPIWFNRRDLPPNTYSA